MTLALDPAGTAAFAVSLIFIVAALWRLLTGLSSRIADIHDRVQTWDEAASNLVEVALQVNRNSHRQQVKGDERHAALDDRLSRLDAVLARMDRRLTGIETHLTAQDKTFSRQHPRAGEE